MKTKMIIMVLLLAGLVMCQVGRSVMPLVKNNQKEIDDESCLTVTSCAKKHTVRFQALITMGGDVELEWGDYIVQADHLAFYEWFDNLTIKEIRDNWGYDVVRYEEIVKGEKK